MKKKICGIIIRTMWGKILIEGVRAGTTCETDFKAAQFLYFRELQL